MRVGRLGVRIFNPDGSEAEKSGNGLRIFSRYLWDRKIVGAEEFAIQTAGGLVRSTIFDGGKYVRVEMGRVSFWSNQIPVTGPRREVLNEKISVGGREFTFCAATIGNPHCVVVGRDTPCAPETARQFGPLLAHRLGWVDRDISVHMPGGAIKIEIGDEFSIRMTGPVTKVAEGVMDNEMLAG